jgi:hypothetical protein
MRSMSTGFILYTLIISSISLCFIARFFVVHSILAKHITHTFCLQHSRRTKLYCVLLFQKRLITNHYDFLQKNITQNSPCVISTLWGSQMVCGYDVLRDMFYVTTEYEKNG